MLCTVYMSLDVDVFHPGGRLRFNCWLCKWRHKQTGVGFYLMAIPGSEQVDGPGDL